MSSESNYIIVFVTTNSTQEAAEISKTLVTEKLAACCNIMEGIRSIYSWENKLCDEQESLIIIKTQSKIFEKLKSRITELHSYQVPEIIAIPIVSGSQPYLDWIIQNTTSH